MCFIKVGLSTPCDQRFEQAVVNGCIVFRILKHNYVHLRNFLSSSGLLIVLGTIDSILIHHAFKTTVASGASVQMVFGFEVIYCYLVFKFLPSQTDFCLKLSKKRIFFLENRQHSVKFKNVDIFVVQRPFLIWDEKGARCLIHQSSQWTFFYLLNYNKLNHMIWNIESYLSYSMPFSWPWLWQLLWNTRCMLWIIH